MRLLCGYVTATHFYADAPTGPLGADGSGRHEEFTRIKAFLASGRNCAAREKTFVVDRAVDERGARQHA
jgi:hypothetical protein